MAQQSPTTNFRGIYPIDCVFARSVFPSLSADAIFFVYSSSQLPSRNNTAEWHGRHLRYRPFWEAHIELQGLRVAVAVFLTWLPAAGVGLIFTDVYRMRSTFLCCHLGLFSILYLSEILCPQLLD